MNIAEVIGWKFNHQAGMRCKEIDGVLTIIDFPNGIPSASEQSKWTQEYEEWEKHGGKIDILVEAKFDGALKASIEEIVAAIKDGSISNLRTADIISQAKARLKTELMQEDLAT